MELTGTVRNVIDFGVIVDIGVHQDGLVHVSRISDKKFIRHPGEVLSVGDIVKVKVLEVDEKKGRSPVPFWFLCYEFSAQRLPFSRCRFLFTADSLNSTVHLSCPNLSMKHIGFH